MERLEDLKEKCKNDSVIKSFSDLPKELLNAVNIGEDTEEVVWNHPSPWVARV